MSCQAGVLSALLCGVRSVLRLYNFHPPISVVQRRTIRACKTLRRADAHARRNWSKVSKRTISRSNNHHLYVGRLGPHKGMSRESPLEGTDTYMSKPETTAVFLVCCLPATFGLLKKCTSAYFLCETISSGSFAITI